MLPRGRGGLGIVASSRITDTAENYGSYNHDTDSSTQNVYYDLYIVDYRGLVYTGPQFFCSFGVFTSIAGASYRLSRYWLSIAAAIVSPTVTYPGLGC